MKRRSMRVGVATTAVALCYAVGLGERESSADPCGMVPPIYTGGGDPIERVGAQKTFVFYKKGMETFVIRPGFKGKVEEFGMLIPFPTPPAIRKVPDKIFSQIAAAVDPPEVVVYVNRYPRRRSRRRMAPASAAPRREAKLSVDSVRVLRQEAVGMYEVAVLEAGSPAALKRWMDNHGYKYPKGMDQACEDYVKLRWCFVAIKTRVGPKSKVDPRPGMRRAKTGLPPGGSFNGHVQGMGFRFKTDGLVVPMRLSAFNKGRLRNIVYILTNGPKRIKQIAKKYVMRQVPGWKLYRNMTRPLPLRVIGGTFRQLNPWQRRNLRRRRNPVPHNGQASELFAADILAARKMRLSHPFEEKEKVLLNIGERLGLRGPQIDNLNAAVLAKERNAAVSRALRHIKRMTMTVVDGDFSREVIAKENLRFAWYRMPKERNTPKNYDARRMGPRRDFPGGILYRGSLDDVREQQQRHAKAAPSWRRHATWIGLAGLLSLLGGLLFWRRRRSGPGGTTLTLLLLVGATAAALLFSSGVARAASITSLIDDLGDAKKASTAIKALVTMGQKAVPKLVDKAFDGNMIERRGWAIAALAEIGGDTAREELSKLLKNPNHPLVVRTWAAAAQVKMAKGADELLKLASSLAPRYPAISRPLGKRLASLLLAKAGGSQAEQLLEAVTRARQLSRVLGPAILALPAGDLMRAMTTAKSQSVRRQAAAYLATAGLKRTDEVASTVVNAYRFTPGAKRVPWDGGPLYVPSLRWPKKHARDLVSQLVRWHLWAERAGRPNQQRQINNNLRSVSLASMAGFSPSWSGSGVTPWLRAWGQVVGKKGIHAILREQGVAGQSRYRRLLKQLR